MLKFLIKKSHKKSIPCSYYTHLISAYREWRRNDRCEEEKLIWVIIILNNNLTKPWGVKPWASSKRAAVEWERHDRILKDTFNNSFKFIIIIITLFKMPHIYFFFPSIHFEWLSDCHRVSKQALYNENIEVICESASYSSFFFLFSFYLKLFPMYVHIMSSLPFILRQSAKRAKWKFWENS